MRGGFVVGIGSGRYPARGCPLAAGVPAVWGSASRFLAGSDGLRSHFGQQIRSFLEFRPRLGRRRSPTVYGDGRTARWALGRARGRAGRVAQGCGAGAARWTRRPDAGYRVEGCSVELAAGRSRQRAGSRTGPRRGVLAWREETGEVELVDECSWRWRNSCSRGDGGMRGREHSLGERSGGRRVTRW